LPLPAIDDGVISFDRLFGVFLKSSVTIS